MLRDCSRVNITEILEIAEILRSWIEAYLEDFDCVGEVCSPAHASLGTCGLGACGLVFEPAFCKSVDGPDGAVAFGSTLTTEHMMGIHYRLHLYCWGFTS